MFLWWGVFVTPFAASTLEWVILSRRRDQLRHVTVILAMAFSTMAPGMRRGKSFRRRAQGPRQQNWRLWHQQLA